MKVLLLSDNKIVFPENNAVIENITRMTTYDNSKDYDVIVVDETVSEEVIANIRKNVNDDVVILDIGPDKKCYLDEGTNAYLQKPYTEQQLFQAIALGRVTHYLLVTYPLDIKANLEKRGIYCL